MLTKEHFKIMKKSPVKFLLKMLGVLRLEDFQKEVLIAIEKYSRVAIAATHSVGKTFLMARVVLWFLYTHKNSKAITTAPTYRQVVKLLWGELRSAHKKSKYNLGGHLTINELKLNDDWYAIGYSPQKEAGGGEQEQKGSTFQGFHALHILVVFDEATGIPPDVWKMVEGLLTSGTTIKFICIGNPTTRNCSFFKCFSSANWKKIYLSCFDSPNLKANNFNCKKDLSSEASFLRTLSDDERLERIASYKKPVPYLLSAQWVIEFVYEWGIDHPLVVSKALGEFPLEDDNVIVQLAQVEMAIARENEIEEDDTRYIGIDVARFGEDKTVFTEIIGKKQTRKKANTKKDTEETANEAMAFIISDTRKTYVLIDATGVGSGVVDKLNAKKVDKLIRANVTIIEMHFGQNCQSDLDKKHYANLKAKIFVELGKDLKNELDILDENIYLGELPTIRFHFDKKGRMQIESKEDYKKRTGRASPDHSDSLAIANYGRHYFAGAQFPEDDNKTEEYTTHAPSINSEDW